LAAIDDLEVLNDKLSTCLTHALCDDRDAVIQKWKLPSKLAVKRRPDFGVDGIAIALKVANIFVEDGRKKVSVVITENVEKVSGRDVPEVGFRDSGDVWEGYAILEGELALGSRPQALIAALYLASVNWDEVDLREQFRLSMSLRAASIRARTSLSSAHRPAVT